MKVFSKAALTLVSLTIPLTLQAREWTATDGRKLQAEFVSSEDEMVTLKLDSNGEEVTFSVTRLSDEDRAWIIAKQVELAKEEQEGAKAVEKKSGELDPELTKLLNGNWETAEHDGLPYSIFAGEEISPTKTYPLVVALHGKSSNKKNGKQDWIIKPYFQGDRYKKNPAILVAPLCYQPFGESGTGWNKEPGKKVLSLIEKLIEGLPVDPKRVYLYGYSMGGSGAVTLIQAKPKLFAAGIVISGSTDGKAARAFRSVPVWAFHGGSDKVVPPNSMQLLARSLSRTKKFKYTEFENAGHSILGKVMNDEKVHEWLFAQKKK